jgi:ABC-type amino acid transport substrate-binding protein
MRWMNQKQMHLRWAILFLFSCFTRLVIAHPSSLTVVSSEWCPYACGKNDEYKGFLVELLVNALPDHKITYRVASRARSMKLIDSGEADIILGVTERDQPHLSLSSSVSENIYCIYTKSKSGFNLKALSDRTKDKLGIVEGYTYPNDLDSFIKKYPTKVSIGTGTVAALNNYQKLFLSRIGGFVENKDIAQWWFETGKTSNLEEVDCQSSGGLHYGVSNKHPFAKQLIDELNHNLQKLKTKGIVTQLRKKYQFKQ